MAVLSVDLAHRRWADIGVCTLEAGADQVVVSPISLPALGLAGAPTAEAVAEVVADLATRVEARLILLDGPQAWKDADNGLLHCRLCERQLATQGKTGLPGVTKPANYAPFIAFAIEVFGRLAKRGWPRLPSASALAPGGRFAVESFPTSAWRSLGLRPLPGKANRSGASVEDKLDELRGVYPLTIGGATSLSHDELQAAVAGLAGIGVGEHPLYAFDLAGVAPFEREGAWREGFIVNPVARGIASWAERRRSVVRRPV
jgi:hypothetical protein